MIGRYRDGSPVETYDGEGKSIEFLYRKPLGRMILKLLISPFVSRTAGFFLDRRPSALLVRPFVKKNRLDLRDYPERPYRSFNDFFTRNILPEKRPIDPDPTRLIAPCDGKLTVFPISEDAVFSIKGVDYTPESLLRDPETASLFRGGHALLFRLTVDDYHRYSYPVTGEKTANIHLKGVYHTVNPRAAAASPIYRENTREYTLIRTESGRSVLMMEIGAMMVGRIRNHMEAGPVTRGQEKGCFEFGGSSIILLLEKDAFRPDADIMKNSQEDFETVIRMGEAIGDLL